MEQDAESVQSEREEQLGNKQERRGRERAAFRDEPTVDDLYGSRCIDKSGPDSSRAAAPARRLSSPGVPAATTAPSSSTTMHGARDRASAKTSRSFASVSPW